MRKQKLVCGLTLALSVSGLFAGCAVERKCGLQGCAGDAQITEKVESLFNEHPEIGTEVNVQTLNHVVYLSGLVSAGEIRTTAEDVAGTAPGVSKVVDTIGQAWAPGALFMSTAKFCAPAQSAFAAAAAKLVSVGFRNAPSWFCSCTVVR